jgi:hypothetical protein
VQNKVKFLHFQFKKEDHSKNKPKWNLATMKKRNEPKLCTACGLAVALGCDPICTNEPILKMILSTITFNTQIAYDKPPPTEDQKNKANSNPIDAQKCRPGFQSGIQFVQNKAK